MAAAAAQQKIEAAVDEAVSKGKSRRRVNVTGSVVHQRRRNARISGSVPAETAVPMSEVGHSIDAAADDAAPAWFYS